MSKLALPSVEIRGYRVFDHLKLEKLGRVNLFVGKNNVGKTSLLEALWIYANQGIPSILWTILEGRSESSLKHETQTENLNSQFEDVLCLFSGHYSGDEDSILIQIGSGNEPEKQVSIEYIAAGNNGDYPLLRYQYGTSKNYYPANLSMRDQRLREKSMVINSLLNILIPAGGLSGEAEEKYWDAITLKPLETEIINSLKILEPGLERINLLSTPNAAHGRTPFVITSRYETRVPLRSLGEGMNRMFGLALSMVNAKNGILLVDEIESGLHYSVLQEMWRFIFDAAKRFNVQVFATTHSLDCITGFQQAAAQSEEDGALIRLENKKGKITSTAFEEKELAIATREKIEVR